MKTNAVLIRTNDGKRFYVTELSHWSEIKACDGSGERYMVKWYGGDGYVATFGPTFRLTEEMHTP